MIIKKDAIIKLKDGWSRSGEDDSEITGRVLGDPVYAEQWWTPVLWSDEDDPTFVKSAAVTVVNYGDR